MQVWIKSLIMNQEFYLLDCSCELTLISALYDLNRSLSFPITVVRLLYPGFTCKNSITFCKLLVLFIFQAIIITKLLLACMELFSLFIDHLRFVIILCSYLVATYA